MSLLLLVLLFHRVRASVVCSGSDHLEPRFVLSGQHLVVGDENWAPYNLQDGSGQWSGFNVDLMDTISILLGFTYEFRNFRANPPSNVTAVPAAQGGGMYNAYLRDLAEHHPSQLEFDMFASYWTVNTYRRSIPGLVIFSPHAEGATPVLVTNPPVMRSARGGLDLSSSLHTAYLPFELSTWLLIILIMMLSAFILAFIERKQHDFKNTDTWSDTIAHSLYLSVMLFAQQGTHQPRTRAGGVFNSFFAFFMMLVVVVYSAALTAGLTVEGVGRQLTPSGILGVDDLIRQGRPACIRALDSNFPRLSNLYMGSGLEFNALYAAPDANYTTDIDMLRRLRAPRFESERCHAVVATSGVVGRWMAPGTDHERLDDVRVLAAELGLESNASEVLALADSQCGGVAVIENFDVSNRGKTAAWVTRADTLCIARAFDWALAYLSTAGTLRNLDVQHLSTGRACGSNVTVGQSGASAEPEGFRSMRVQELLGILIIWGVGFALTVVCMATPSVFGHGYEYHGKQELSNALNRMRTSAKVTRARQSPGLEA